MIDLIVAGGGPVGLAVAIHARLVGMTVTVVDPRSGPIDKACGEGLMPDAVRRLAAIGVDPPGRAFMGIRYTDGRRSAQASFAGEAGRGVRRTTLHDGLHARAAGLGAGFVAARVEAVRQDASGVEAAGLRARYLVGADGLHSAVRRQAGLDRPARGRRRFGVRQHFRVEPWTDHVEVHWRERDEVYVTPVADDTVGVAVLGGRPIDVAAAIGAVPELADRLRGAAPASTARGAGPLRQQAAARARGRVLLAGDAAGYVDALTGEGLRVGFAEAEAVIGAIVRDDPASYDREWARLTRSYRVLTEGLLWTSQRAALRPLIVPAARALPWAFSRIVNSLGS